METCYHYTIADRLTKILISKHIKLMEESSKYTDYEMCFAWLTTSPEWDRTAFYGYPEEVLNHAGRIRITLKKSYPSYLDFMGAIPNLIDLEFSGRKAGVDPTNWRVSKEIIPIADFAKIELWFWKEKKWVEVPGILPKEEQNGIDDSSEEHC